MSTYGTPHTYQEGMGESDWGSLPDSRQRECVDCGHRFDGIGLTACPECDTPCEPCSCQHGEHEDCMICSECGECREDLDDDDLCPDCGGEVQWFKNFYICDGCGYDWTDEWPAMCDDDCPQCGARHMSPHKSEDAFRAPLPK